MNSHTALTRGCGNSPKNGEFSDVHEARISEIRKRQDEFRTKVNAAAREGKSWVW
jgi:hypothetical protein